MKRILGRVLPWFGVLALVVPVGAFAQPPQSVARQWSEELLDGIRTDFARPTIHARNLFHVSAAMYDAWAAYDDTAGTWLHHEKATAANVEAAREETISYAAYRLLKWRFRNSPGKDIVLPSFDARMDALGYDKDFTSTEGNSPAALGNRIGQHYIDFGLTDGSNEENGYANEHYEPINPPLVVALPGNPNIIDPNRWQPLAIEFFIDQGGNVIPGGFPPALSPEWGRVVPFSLTPDDLYIVERDGYEYWGYHDPGPPPYIGTNREEEYRAGFERVEFYSGLLDPTDGVMIDVSPASNGNNELGTNNGHGYDMNPATGQPYEPEVVPAGDYYRVLAEFWADGPNSETPPGHWFTILNYVNDQPQLVKRMGGEGPLLNDLEWDVKTYFIMGGAMHDCAISAWGTKGAYDYVRPISALRFMADHGQSSDPSLPNYDPVNGIRLFPGKIEMITEETIQPGERHEHLAGPNNENVGKIAFHAWRGPTFVENPETDTAGVGWILAENWWPYQRPSFVTPPFPGYVSGHSTYSRAASTVMTLMTGDEFFPGGLGTFDAPKNEFLVFEDGPSVDIELRWARYFDASDETSLSRIYGGIHPTQDDIPGRFMGDAIAPEAYEHALEYFNGDLGTTPSNCTRDETTMCLNSGRFQVRVDWRDFEDQTGDARVVQGVQSDDSGIFFFFSPNNWEMLVKVLTGCGINGHYWVFAAATTNVEYTLTVTDTATDAVMTYTNPLGVSSPSITDTGAFATCP